MGLLDGLQAVEDALHVVSRHLESADQGGPTAHPWVTLAWAQTCNGVLTHTRGHSTAISGEVSLTFTHGLRTLHDAILVGVETVRADNPRLSARLHPGKSPRAVILDSRLRCPPDARVITDARLHDRPLPMILYAERYRDDKTVAQRRAYLADAGVTCHPIPESVSGDELPRDAPVFLDLGAVRSALAGEAIRSIMVEGGGSVMASFLEAGDPDLLAVTVAPWFSSGYHLPLNVVATPPPPNPEKRGSDHTVAWLPLGRDIVLVKRCGRGAETKGGLA